MRSGHLFASLVAMVVGITSGGQETFAEPVASPEFYDHNYAATVGGQQGPNKPKIGRERGSAKGITPESVAPKTSALAGVPDRAKRRRLAVSVYVNSKDSAHFNRTLDEILRLHDTKMVRITDVSHIGDYRAITEDVKKKLGARDIVVGQVDVPPEDFGITISPAWCVQTREGLHIVQGFSSIAPFIDAWGDFKASSVEQAAPEEKLAGF